MTFYCPPEYDAIHDCKIYARTWIVEFKRPDGVLRPGQVAMIEALKELDHYVDIVDDVERFKWMARDRLL